MQTYNKNCWMSSLFSRRVLHFLTCELCWFAFVTVYKSSQVQGTQLWQSDILRSLRIFAIRTHSSRAEVLKYDAVNGLTHSHNLCNNIHWSCMLCRKSRTRIWYQQVRGFVTNARMQHLFPVSAFIYLFIYLNQAARPIKHIKQQL